MFKQVAALALGIVLFAIIIGVGIVVLTEFGNAIGGTGNTTLVSLVGELGTSGLAGWTASIVALSIGILFIVALSGKRSY